MAESSKPSIGLLLALALAARDEGEADKIVRLYFRREITLEEAIRRLREMKGAAIII